MRLIVAGCRWFEDGDVVQTELDVARERLRSRGNDIEQVVSGCARGVDTLAIRWAEARGIPVARFPADWKRYGRAAGPRRNEEMARHGDGLLAFWDGRSKGTENMIACAARAGLRVRVFQIDRQRVNLSEWCLAHRDLVDDEPATGTVPPPAR